jgi:hypothetical protein
MAKCDKHIKRGRIISNEYENIISNEIVSILNQSIPLGKSHIFQYDELTELLINNKRYPDFLLKDSNNYNKIIGFVNFYKLGSFRGDRK